MITNWDGIILHFHDEKAGDEGVSIFGEYHVGAPEQGYELVVGEGDSYTRGMLVYTYNGSIYTDISSAAP